MGRDTNHPDNWPGERPVEVAPDVLSGSPAVTGDEFPIVGVGASAGGLEAFKELLKQLPAQSGMAFVLIQHLDPTHTSFLREALAKATTMAIIQPADGTAVEPNHVYVIPPDADITMAAGRLALSPRTADGPRPHLPIDLFFRSLAAERGSHAIGVVLSGNASDGTEGLRAIKAENGIALAQEPKSAKFGEMPRSAIDAGVVDAALPIPALAEELVRLSRHPYLTVRGVPQESPPSGEEAEAVSRILTIVRSTLGVDFAEYKGPTFQRRLARRMALRRAGGPREYLTLLEREPQEIRALYEDILIHVTSFFRDPEVFAALEAQILPAIVEQKQSGAPIRVWVAGCSTGEEVYSIGISLLDVLGDATNPVQIFGSDLSEATIAKARAGVYPDAALRDVSDERRKRYFVKTDRGYRINKTVRDLCVFVQHDLARDAPFSKLDLVSCRNVLIYFDPVLQRRILPTFHYALNQPGYLLLGRTESIAGFGHWFSPVDKGNRIFARTAVANTLRFAPRSTAQSVERRAADTAAPLHAGRTMDLGRHLDRVLLARYAPPGVLINEKMEVLQFRGQTGGFLQPAPGEPQNDIIKMARPGLVSALRAVIAEAKKEVAPAVRNGVEVDQDGFARTCNLVAFPFTGPPDVKEPLYVVLFEEAVPAEQPGDGTRDGNRRRRSDWLDDGRRIPKVEHELMATKEYLQSLIEEHGRTNDDLGSANEELVSGNEELQSMNEELETAKEELQSTNEELTTVNDELHSRNQEVTQANSDLLNLLVTVDVPIIILDIDRRIRRFTPKARSILNVLPSDTGRPIDDIKPNIAVADLDRQIAEVIETMAMKESEVQDREGRWYRMQIRPYRTTDNKIDGAILSLVDIDALKHLVGDAQQARSEAEQANHAKDLFLAVLGHELRTPLTTLLLRAQMLGHDGAADPVKLARTAEIIERATRVQMQLVDDLLDVSKIIAGKLKVKLRAVDLSSIVRAAVEGMTGPVQAKSIRLDVTVDESIGAVEGDPTRLQQVVSNLLTNAVKFTPQKGRVAVTLDAHDGLARLRVSDTGAGIDPTFLPQVFNRFAQGDTSNTRVHGGLGLGLAIVRHLVEQHHGTVKAESPGLGKGATFSVTLPLAKVRQESAEDGVRSVDGKNSARLVGDKQMKDLSVLVVDDDLATREAVADMLKGMGAQVLMAGSASEALTTVREFRPQVLLCDIAMPGEDGYTFIRKLRTFGPAEGGETPALALTALTAEGDQQRSLAAGFQMHLTKPVDLRRLSEAVVRLAAPQEVS
jgi:chemotaxis methyl-accepting protein methylase/signal transduction histidine kinase/chemotaxis response regulator CheB